MMGTETRRSAGVILGEYATHFSQKDWEYSRNTHLHTLQYKHDVSGYNSLSKRVGRFWTCLFEVPSRKFVKPRGFWSGLYFHLYYAFRQLRTDTSFPDGGLSNGSILTQWEEDGEYIQLVQPSVGALVAEFLESDPTNPYAEKITAEINRILDGYRERIRSDQISVEDDIE